jgi:hypothetical protein
MTYDYCPSTTINGAIPGSNGELLSHNELVVSLAFEIAEKTCSPGFMPTDEDWDLAELLATA